ncbi:MAG: helix-turn-helix transcriptional regulator [Cyanothece sp. SIO2G6]|nr:helix-turn-helix transcriptional regulator [Cyanothece sp. SIO2G6]
MEVREASLKKNCAQVLTLPNPTCSGSIERWQLRPGLDLVVHDVRFRETITINRNRADDKLHLGLTFCLAGQIRGTDSMSKQLFQFERGQASLGVIDGSNSQVEYAGKQRVSLVHIHVQPDVIPLTHPEGTEQLPGALRDAIVGRDSPLKTLRDRQFYFHSCAMTPVMSATVQQLLHCPYQGLSQQLYIEAKTLELIGLYFDQLFSTNSLRQQISSLKAEDVDRIVYARDILLSRVTNPPTLLELSRLIGLNDRKLKQGFRQVFGTTVLGYLHDHRMEQAQQLLLTPGTTIAGVAQQVGYRSPEAFSSAFRRTFSINPKSYQLQKR